MDNLGPTFLTDSQLLGGGSDTPHTLLMCAPVDIEDTINCELVRINDWLISNKLHFNVAKTEYMLIGSHKILSSIYKSPSVCKKCRSQENCGGYSGRISHKG